MLDDILWFIFGAILIFPYGVWCGAKWSGGYKKWREYNEQTTKH